MPLTSQSLKQPKCPSAFLNGGLKTLEFLLPNQVSPREVACLRKGLSSSFCLLCWNLGIGGEAWSVDAFSPPTWSSWGLPTCSCSFLVNIQYRRLYQSMNSQYLKLLATQVSKGSTARALEQHGEAGSQGRLKRQEVNSLACGPVVDRVRI